MPNYPMYAGDPSGPRPSITCPKCGRTSHNPNDVRERYCGNCHQYHDTMGKVGW